MTDKPNDLLEAASTLLHLLRQGHTIKAGDKRASELQEACDNTLYNRHCDHCGRLHTDCRC